MFRQLRRWMAADLLARQRETYEEERAAHRDSVLRLKKNLDRLIPRHMTGRASDNNYVVVTQDDLIRVWDSLDRLYWRM